MMLLFPFVLLISSYFICTSHLSTPIIMTGTTATTTTTIITATTLLMLVQIEYSLQPYRVKQLKIVVKKYKEEEIIKPNNQAIKPNNQAVQKRIKSMSSTLHNRLKHPSIHQSIHPSIHTYIYQSIYKHIHLSIHPFIKKINH